MTARPSSTVRLSRRHIPPFKGTQYPSSLLVRSSLSLLGFSCFRSPSDRNPTATFAWDGSSFISHMGVVETHASLGVHIPISVHPSSFALLSTATRTQPARELSDAQLGTSDRVLRRSCMSSYSLPLPASVTITRNSFGSVWTRSRYSAQPPAPNPHESSPMHSLVHPIGSCEGPA